MGRRHSCAGLGPRGRASDSLQRGAYAGTMTCSSLATFPTWLHSYVLLAKYWRMFSELAARFFWKGLKAAASVFTMGRTHMSLRATQQHRVVSLRRAFRRDKCEE